MSNDDDARLLTPQERVDAYNAEHKAIREKYRIVLGAEPFIDPMTGAVRARAVIDFLENVQPPQKTTLDASAPVAEPEPAKAKK